jgi:hypothetical protein
MTLAKRLKQKTSSLHTRLPQRSPHHPQRSPRHGFLHHRLHYLRVIRSSPSAAKEVEFGTTITTADESIVSGAGGAIDRGDEVKEDTPTGEGKGKRRADIDAVAKFEEREAKKRMVSSSEKCWGNRTSYSQRRKGSREWIERDGLHALQCSQIDQRVSKWKTDICDVFQE